MNHKLQLYDRRAQRTKAQGAQHSVVSIEPTSSTANGLALRLREVILLTAPLVYRATFQNMESGFP